MSNGHIDDWNSMTTALVETLKGSEGAILWATDSLTIFQTIKSIYSAFQSCKNVVEAGFDLQSKVKELENYILVDLERHIAVQNGRAPYYLHRIKSLLDGTLELAKLYRADEASKKLQKDMDHQTAQIQAACLEYGFCHSLEVLKTADEAQSKLDHLKLDLSKLEKALTSHKENNSMLATELHNIIAQQQGIKQALSEANFSRIRPSYDEIGHRIERLENNIGTNTISIGSSTVQRYIDIQKTLNPAFVGALCQFENEKVINDHMIHPGTRGWILERFSRWQKGEKKLYFVTGKHGSGKTALSAAICKLHSSHVAATHFFNGEEGRAAKNTANGLIQSIAAEMCKTVPEYLIYMEEKYRSDFSEIRSCVNGDWKNAYDTLLKNPLNAIFGKGHAGKGSGHRQVILIDGLDECERSQWDDVKALLGAFIKDISHCLCMFVTVRTKYCGQLLPKDDDLVEGVGLEDRAWINRHIKDIEIYLTSSLGAVLSGEDRCDTPEHAKADEFTLQKTVDELLKNSAGRFDYAIDLMETFAREMGSSGQFLSSVKKAAQPIRAKCGLQFEQKIGDFASPFRAYRDKEGRSVQVRVIRQSQYLMDKTRVALIRGRHANTQ